MQARTWNDTKRAIAAAEAQTGKFSKVHSPDEAEVDGTIVVTGFDDNGESGIVTLPDLELGACDDASEDLVTTTIWFPMTARQADYNTSRTEMTNAQVTEAMLTRTGTLLWARPALPLDIFAIHSFSAIAETQDDAIDVWSLLGLGPSQLVPEHIVGITSTQVSTNSKH